MKNILCAILVMFLCRMALAEHPKQVVFFGDSLTDNGNLYRSLLKIIPKSPPYYNGRFTNGPSWAEYIEQFYLTKYNVPSLNYAVGGATVVLRNPKEGYLPYNLAEEVNKYLIPHPLVNKDQILFIIWMGANDYLNGATNVDKETTDVVKETKSVIDRLIRKGARHFVIMNLPDLAKTPFASHVSDPNNLHQLTLAHNQKLAVTIKQLQTDHPEVQFLVYDIYSLFEDILLHTEKYNQKYHQHITHLYEACWPGGYVVQTIDKKDLNHALRKNLMSNSLEFDNLFIGNVLLQSPSIAETFKTYKAYTKGVVPCGQPDEYLFWDQVHPSAVVHQMLSAIIIEDLVRFNMTMQNP